jgi:hypothetical protein
MERMLTMLGMFILGSLGWWIGEFVGIFTAAILSLVGSGLGLYLGRRIAAEYY